MSTDIETCLSSFEMAVTDSTRQIRMKLQQEIQKQEMLRKEYEKLNHETAELQQSISQLDEDTRNTYTTFTTSRETCEAFRRSNEFLRNHVNSLKDKLERQKSKYVEETANMKTNVDHYQLKWNEYYVRYERHPLAQKLAEKKKELAKVEEQLKIYQSELRQSQADLFRMKCERARRNSEDVFQHLEKFVLTLASIKVETNKCLADIALTKQEVGDITQVINSHKHTRENFKVLRPSSQMKVATNNEPSHIEIIKNNVVSQMEVVTNNEPFHMEIVKDNLIGQMEFTKDCELKAMNEKKEIGQSSVFIDNGKCIDTTGTKQCQSLSYTPRVNKPKLTKENIFQLFIPQLPLLQETKTKTYSIKSLPQEQEFKEVSDGRFSSSKVDEDEVRLSESCENRDNISKIINTYLTPFLNSKSYETPKCTKNTADMIRETQDNEEQLCKAKGDITSSPHSPLNFIKCQEILNQLKKSPGFVYKSRSMIQQDEKCKTQNIQKVPSSFVNSLAGINQFQTEVRQLDLKPSDRFEESYQRSSDKLGSVSTAQEETGKLSGSHFVTDCQSLNLTTAKETFSVTNKDTFAHKRISAVTDSPISSQQNRPANDAESPNEPDKFSAVMFRHQNYEDTPSTSFFPSSPNPSLFFDFGSSETTKKFNIFGSTNQSSSMLDLFGSGNASLGSSQEHKDNGEFSFSFTSKNDKLSSKLFNFPF